MECFIFRTWIKMISKFLNSYCDWYILFILLILHKCFKWFWLIFWTILTFFRKYSIYCIINEINTCTCSLIFTNFEIFLDSGGGRKQLILQRCFFSFFLCFMWSSNEITSIFKENHFLVWQIICSVQYTPGF